MQDSVLSYHTSTTSHIMPYYFIFFLYGSQDIGTSATALWRKLKNTFDHYDPTPLFFFFPDHLNSYHQHPGLVYCWFCSEQYKWWGFNCTVNGVACPNVMMETYGKAFGDRKNIPWIFSKKGHVLNIQNITGSCSLTLRSNASCALNPVHRFVGFLLHNSNWTWEHVGAGVSGSNKYVRAKIPRLEYGPAVYTRYPIDLLLTEQSCAFRFITSDGVRQGQSSLHAFLGPFDTTVWLWLVVFTFVTALCLASFSRNQNLAGTIFSSFLTMVSTLLDQSPAISTHLHRIEMQAINTIMTFWCVAICVITNSYKGILKSDYVLEPKYTTSWKSLTEMTDFAVIYPFRSTDAQELEDTNTNFRTKMRKECNVEGKRLYTDSCVHKKESRSHWCDECNTIAAKQADRPECLFFTEIYVLKKYLQRVTRGENRMWLEKQLEFMEKITAKGRIRPIEMLEAVIANELVKKKTVFVTPSEHFHNDWQVFRKWMKSKRHGVAFAGSERDESFGLASVWYISSGYNEHTFGNFMSLRAAALMESGIHGVWGTWDQMRRRLGEPTPVVKDLAALSFQNSDIHFHFFLYLSGLLVAFLVLLAEAVAIKFERGPK